MAIFKCKMCGGDLEIKDTDKVIECEYCGTNQTVPSADNEKKLNLFNRANRLRINGEFDKATAIYENIVAEFPEEAEAYWGLVICNYGIEYVDDPASARKIPTCHRASFESIEKDENFAMALEYADVVAQKVYRDEAREIDRIREEILSVSKNEKPYDIFICYKETAENGERTVDSVLAQDVYDALTAKGYRVFFARISLEDKLGRQYEPYIFAALNSAKIMLSFGTKYEYFHAVWVKNEWSRFLKLMAKDKSKVLIPCYKDMDAYDMPDEFKALQAQDLGKVGSIQDLIRGISKILGSNETVQVVTAASAPTGALTKRGYFFLEDEDFNSANEYFDKALDENPEDSKAYAGKVLAGLRKKDLAELNDSFVKLYEDKNFERAIRFAEGADKAQLEKIKETADKKWFVKHLTIGLAKYAAKKETEEIKEKISGLAGTPTVEAYDEITAIYEDAYNRKVNQNYFTASLVRSAKRKADILRLLTNGEEYTISSIKASKYFSDEFVPDYQIESYLNSMLEEGCVETGLEEGKYCIIGAVEKLIEKKNRNKYELAKKIMTDATINGDYESYFSAANFFFSLGDYQDAATKAEECKQLGEKLKVEIEVARARQEELRLQELARQEAERKATEEKRLEEERIRAELAREEAEKRAKKVKIIACILIPLICILFAIVGVITYNNMQTQKEAEKEKRAYAIPEMFKDYKLGDDLFSDDVSDVVITVNGVNGHLYADSDNDKTIDELYWVSSNSNGNTQEIVDNAHELIISYFEDQYGQGKDVILSEGVIPFTKSGEIATQFVTKSGMIYLVGPNSQYNIYVVQVKESY